MSLDIALSPEGGAPSFVLTAPSSGMCRIDITPVDAEVPGAGVSAKREADAATTTTHGIRIHATYDGDILQPVEMVSAGPVAPPVPRDKYDAVAV